MLYLQTLITKKVTLLTIILALISPLAIHAQDITAAQKPESGSQVAPNPPASVLPPSLGGFQTTSDVKEFRTDNLRELAADMEQVFREYRVIAAASRDYGHVKAEVFQTQNQFAAFGLFSFVAGATKNQPEMQPLGSESVRVGNGIVFWKGNVFVRLQDTTTKFSTENLGVRRSWASGEGLARAISDAIVTPNASVKYPTLLDSLPAASKLPGSEQYFLGPESLNADVAHSREMFDFVGETEAVTADYKQSAASIGSQGNPIPDQAVSNSQRSKEPSTAPDSLPLTLVIVECHTPEFATDELARVTGYVTSLTENEQQQIVFKRTGNYIIAAVNVRDREFAEGLINSIQYPYTVKWLRNPLWPTNDPFRTQKAAQMLLSTFGLLGLIILTVILGGSIFGASVFLKRRKQQREVFSDAGGMLRLDIEPFVLALPPKRDN